MTKTYTYTRKGFNLYLYFTSLRCQGCISTDLETKYVLPDGTLYSRPDEVEDWFIRTAEQIKSERMKILIEK